MKKANLLRMIITASIIIATLVATAVVLILPSGAADTYSGSCGENLEWSFEVETATLNITGTGEMYDYGWDDAPWYSYRRSIYKINIADGVTSIGNYAFASCAAQLTRVSLPDSITSIGDYAFYDCEKLQSLKIPSGVTYIGEWAFYHCSELASITIPSTVVSIGSNAFKNIDLEYTEYNNGKYLVNDENQYVALMDVIDTSVSSFVIPDGVKIIYDNAFSACSNLTSLEIPSSITAIGIDAFADDLEYTEYNNGKYLGNGDDKYLVLVDVIDPTVLEFDMPNGVKIIYDEAFKWCSDIKKITLSSSVQSIGNYAFYNCMWLEKIDISSDLTRIGDYSFYGCRSLESIDIPSSVESIGDYAFFECASLKNIKIPSSVNSVGFCAFEDCTGLESVSFKTNSSLNRIDSSTFKNCKSLESIELPSGIIYIGNTAFADCSSLKSLVIPASVMSVGESILTGCTSLENITIPFLGASKNGTSNTHFGYIFGAQYDSNNDQYVPTSLKSVEITGGTSIDDDAFCYCSGIESVKIGDGVTTIRSNAFQYCTSLESIEIPSSVREIGSGVFSGCNSLKTVTFGENSKLIAISAHLFSDCNRLVDIEIPSSVTSIGDGAFSGCTSLVGIDIPSGVTEIGTGVFGGCTSLETITVNSGNTVYHSSNNCLINTEDKVLISGCKNSVIPTDGSVESIGAYAFDGCTELMNIVIPEGVISIGEYAFIHSTNIKSIEIPSSVTSIGDGAFSGCSNLETITVNSNNDVYHSSGNCLIDTQAKRLIAGCKNSVIPADGSVTSIGNSAFASCTDLNKITISEGVTNIEASAFSNCSHLEIVTISSTVTNIGDSAFSDCRNIDTVYNCSRLDIVAGSSSHGYISADASNVFNHLFENCSSNGNGTHNATCSLCEKADLQDCVGGEATCASGKICENCNAPYGEPLGHDLEHHGAKAPDCINIGWNEYDTCKRDGCEYTTYAELPAKGHTSADPVRENEVASTCTEAGYYDSVVYCSECNQKLSVEFKPLDALGHSYLWLYDKDWHWQECSCGESTGAENHNLGDDNICDECGYEDQNVVDSEEQTTEDITSSDNPPSSDGVQNPSNNDQSSSGGCFSTVSGGAAVMASIISICGLAFRKKKED